MKVHGGWRGWVVASRSYSLFRVGVLIHVILVDTSVWIDHLRRSNPVLVTALEAGLILTHPFVLGELACGTLTNRISVLALLGRLPGAPVATEAEALGYMERHSLMGRGIGYIDVHLLAATALTGGAYLWTLDKRLNATAVAMCQVPAVHKPA